MKELLIRADDLGYCEAVNYGIEKTVKEGLIRSVGLMVNMPAASHGLRLLEGTDVCLGLHINICLGKPCADPAGIPSLLDENGNLKSSRLYRAAHARGEEIAGMEDLVREIEAQYFRFLELTGREPGYFEAHAVTSGSLRRALAVVADRYHLKYSDLTPEDSQGHFAGTEIAACHMKSMEPDYDPWESLKEAVRKAREDMPNVFVCHPGYLDDFILRTSSLTLNRTKEAAMLCDPAMREWLSEQDVRLITYDDIPCR